MEKNVQQASSVLRKVAIMTLIGFLAVVLSGPIIAALATILPFAIVGGLIYLVIKAIMLGPYVVGKLIGQTFRGIFFLLIGLPLRVFGKAGRAVGFLVHSVWSALAFTLSIAFPALLGGVIGGILGVIGGMEHGDVDMRAPAGLLIGAAIGVVAGFVLRERRHSKPVVLHPAMPQTVLPA